MDLTFPILDIGKVASPARIAVMNINDEKDPK
jgi:hypothetical protein